MHQLDVYMWSTGATTSSIFVSESGDYSVSGTINGCTLESNTLTFTSTVLPTVTYEGVDLICSPEFSTYQWFRDYSIIDGATGQSYTPIAEGIYYVVVEDVGGCTETSSELVVSISSITESDNDFDIQMYPIQHSVSFRLPGSEQLRRFPFTMFLEGWCWLLQPNTRFT
jgi:hypothetical protein